MKQITVALALVFALVVSACGPNRTVMRYSYYQTSHDRVVTVLETALEAQDYPYKISGRGPNYRSYTVGPLWYDADKQRLPSRPVGPVPDGTYAVNLFIEVTGNPHKGYYLSVSPGAVQYQGGERKAYHSVLPIDSFGPNTDPFAHDSFYASIADPVFEAVYGELKQVASDRPSIES